MSKVRWVISYGFCSQFHTFQQRKNFENRLTFDKVTEFKGGNFFETQCSNSLYILILILTLLLWRHTS